MSDLVIGLSIYKNEKGEIGFACTKPELVRGTIDERAFVIWLDGLNQLAEGSFQNKVNLPEITLRLNSEK
jgi:hypothetical protein